MEKKLPFICPPIIDAYAGVAGNIAVEMNYECYIPLIISNHFLITYSNEWKFGGFNWAYYNDNYGIYRDLRTSVNEVGLIQTLINSINNDLHIHIILDHYYIRQSERYNKEHFTHDTATIFGYNSEKSIFYVADNFMYGKYSILEITYDEIISSRELISDMTIESFYFQKDIDYVLDIKYLIVLIKSYIDSTCYIDESKKNEKNVNKMEESEIYGVRVYYVLINQIKMLSIDPSTYDVRTFHVMCNHISICVLLFRLC